FYAQYTRNNMCFRVIKCPILRRSSFFIYRTKYNFWNLRPIRSSRTHDTGLYGNIQRAIFQIFAPHIVGGGGKSLHLCMCSYIIQSLSEVTPPPYKLALSYHNS